MFGWDWSMKRRRKSGTGRTSPPWIWTNSWKCHCGWQVSLITKGRRIVVSLIRCQVPSSWTCDVIWSFLIFAKRSVRVNIFNRLQVLASLLSPFSEFGEWESWSDCSTTCGPGDKVRTRACSVPKMCAGEAEEKQNCKITSCPTWAPWLEWSGCSKTCGGGQKVGQILFVCQQAWILTYCRLENGSVWTDPDALEKLRRRTRVPLRLVLSGAIGVCVWAYFIAQQEHYPLLNVPQAIGTAAVILVGLRECRNENGPVSVVMIAQVYQVKNESATSKPVRVSWNQILDWLISSIIFIYSYQLPD